MVFHGLPGVGLNAEQVREIGHIHVVGSLDFFFCAFQRLDQGLHPFAGVLRNFDTDSDLSLMQALI